MKALRFVLALWGASLVATVAAFGQPPDSLWSRRFGGGDDDKCWSMGQTSDSGYFLAGDTYSFGAGGRDFWLVRTDSDGDSLWSRTFGGSHHEQCFDAQQTSDGGYILAGHTRSFGAAALNPWLLKTNADGDSQWSRTFGGSLGGVCRSVRQTSDEGYVLAGYAGQVFDPPYNAGWVMKTNAYGDSLWSRIYGGPDRDWFNSVRQTSDGGYMLVGFTASIIPATSFWFVKTDTLGHPRWIRSLRVDLWDECQSVEETSDGGYILAGQTRYYGGDCDVLLVKTDSAGDTLWSRTFGGFDKDRCFAVHETPDHGFILAGDTRSFGAGGADYWLVRTDSIGDSLWSCTFGSSDWEECCAGERTPDGGFVVAGSSGDAMGPDDLWLVKTGPELPIEPRRNPAPIEYALCQNYPNPFNPSTQIAYELTKAGHVSLIVYDLLGREVGTLVDEVRPIGSHSVTFDGSGLASGVYLYRFQAGDFVATKKMVLLK